MNLKRLLLGVLVFLVLVVVIGGTVLWMAVRKLTDRDFLVAQIEENFNCRAEIESVEFEIWGGARLMVTGLAIGPRDGVVEQGTPQSERKPMTNTAYIQHVDLLVETLPLFRRKLVVRNLEIESPEINLTIFADGTTSLDELLRKPKSGEPKAPEPKPEEPAAAEPAAKSAEFTVDDLQISAIADRFGIENLTINAFVEKTGTLIQVFNGNIIARNVDIDPSNLAQHNSIDLDYDAHIAVDSTFQGQRFVDFAFDGEGLLRPFDPITRELVPRLDTTVGATKDSYIDGLVILDEIESVVGELEAFDVYLGEDFRLRGDFSADTKEKIRFTVHRGRFHLVTGTEADPNDFTIPFDRNLLILEEGSWIDSANDQHHFNVTFFLSKTLTQRVEEKLDEFSAKFDDLPEPLANELKKIDLKERILGPAKVGDNLMIRLSSSGSIGSPTIVMHTKFGSVGGDGGGLESLLKGILGDGEETGEDEDPLKELESGVRDLLRSLGGDDEEEE